MEAFEYFLKPGYIVVHHAPSLVYFVMGSGVVVSMWDPEMKMAGMCHFRYPAIPENTPPTARYGNVAVPKTLKMLLESGARKERLIARIYGGADRNSENMGRKNLEAAMDLLKNLGLAPDLRHTGGSSGWKVVYNVQTDEGVAMKVDRIRNSDWFPYVEER